MRNQKYHIKLMGINPSKELIDCSFHQMPFTNRTNPPCSCWESHEAKNYNYYFKRPSTHISRKNYRWYQRGFFWGYYNIPVKYGEETKAEGDKAESLSTEIERCF